MNPQETLDSIRADMQQYSSYAIAKTSGLDPATVRAVRNGVNTNPQIETLIKIHNALESLTEETAQ